MHIRASQGGVAALGLIGVCSTGILSPGIEPGGLSGAAHWHGRMMQGNNTDSGLWTMGGNVDSLVSTQIGGACESGG